MNDRNVRDVELREALEAFERSRNVVAVIIGQVASNSRELSDALAIWLWRRYGHLMPVGG